MKVWKVILAALVIFSAGVVTGRLTFQLDLLTPPPPDPNAPAPRQRRELVLADLPQECRNVLAAN